MTETRTSIRNAVAARLARRHRAERRFQAYGVAALSVAIVFLGVLLGSIAIQSAPAFTHHTLTLPVQVTAERADPRGDGSEASLRRGSYNAMIQDALREQFPSVTDRAALRDLFGLFSAVNAAKLLNGVVDEPDMIGSTIGFSMPISDDADLYLKGVTVDERFEPGPGRLSPSARDGAVALIADDKVFESVLENARAEIAARLEATRARLSLARERAAAAIGRDAQESAAADVARLEALAERLEARAEPGQTLPLGANTPTVFARLHGGTVLLDEIAADGRSATGEVVIGLDASTPSSEWTLWTVETPPAARLISDRQIAWARALEERGLATPGFNTILFTNADSREPELAGVLGAIIGSLLTMAVTMLLAVPIGVGTAIYLEEFAPKNRLTDFIEVNINNLAAVPSIVFGLLGLAVFINAFGLPRSVPLVGGMVLALMTLPTVIISSRAALRAVPPSIREAALGVGASKTQAVFHHVLPMAMPGILTGTIIGLAQALGETAPLLMIGMVAFIADPPALALSGFTEPATVMPVQVFLWSSGAERAFEARTAAAILVLLVLMLAFNALAIFLRRRFERRW